MKKDDILYGLEHWERLEMSVEDVMELVLDEACDHADESFDTVADRIDWPVRIALFKRMDIGGEKKAQRIADRIIAYILNDLDTDYGDPDGIVDTSDPTTAMKNAALAFGRAVVADYIPWTAQETGEIIEYTREEAREDYD